MATNFLLVGLATDGPSNVPYKPKNERELRSLFGGNFRERFYVSPSATAIVMQFEPYSLPLNEVDHKKQYLFAPYLDQNTRQDLYFGNIGGSGNHLVDLIYTPYTGKGDLIVAAARYYSITGEMPYVIRLGGTTASVSIDGWNFEAKYPGNRYNYLGLSASGSSLVLFGMEPNYPRKTFTFSSVEQLRDSITRSYELGTCPVYCTQAGTAMITAGTYYLSGGTDGSFSDTDLDFFLTNFSIPIRCDHILLLNEITSGMVTSISDHLQVEDTQPRMFFIPSIAYYGTGSANEWITYMSTALPYRSNMIASIIGDVTVNYFGETVTRYAAEAAAIAFSQGGGFNLTNLPVEAETFTPVLSEDNLKLVKAAGFMPLMRYIKNDISVYQGTTTYAENTFLYSSKVAEISAIAYDYCFQYFGVVMTDGPKPEIAQELRNRLRSVQYVEIQKVEVSKEGEEMFVKIEGVLPNEILQISFTIQNK